MHLIALCMNQAPVGYDLSSFISFLDGWNVKLAMKLKRQKDKQ
jgi:hypothetical protein